ncbi:hypothetical protein scyTo_0000159 [Scyliorhinus torazame]|uniref:Uncharacterized protein n=1 Tax=Scyliorhinus torazame TaxID=75743 RepID=A0A401NRI3_SCYTO|nr:hypothetical protein [Scyliorhinus torazame]
MAIGAIQLHDFITARPRYGQMASLPFAGSSIPGLGHCLCGVCTFSLCLRGFPPTSFGFFKYIPSNSLVDAIAWYRILDLSELVQRRGQQIHMSSESVTLL